MTNALPAATANRSSDLTGTLCHSAPPRQKTFSSSLSVITQYEVLRGVLAKGATGQHRAFERFCGSSEVLAITPRIIEQAAEIYTNLYRRGLLIGDAEILIAATALSHRYVLATNNGFHFGRIAELQIDNWLEG